MPSIRDTPAASSFIEPVTSSIGDSPLLKLYIVPKLKPTPRRGVNRWVDDAHCTHTRARHAVACCCVPCLLFFLLSFKLESHC